MTTVQAKIVSAGVMALIAWLFSRKAAAAPAADPGRVSKELVVGINVLDPDTFGLTEEEIAARNRNPAIDPEMRRLIDLSNAVIAADDLEEDRR